MQSERRQRTEGSGDPGHSEAAERPEAFADAEDRAALAAAVARAVEDLVAPALRGEVTSAVLAAVRAALEAEYLAGFRDGWTECLEAAEGAHVPSPVSWSAEVVALPLHDAIPSARDMAARGLRGDAGPQAVPGGRWRRTAVRRASEGTVPN